MKHSILIVILAIGFTVNAQNKGINFRTDTLLSNLLSHARNENNLIFLDCFTTWCGPCRIMDRNVFSDQEVDNFFNKNFISAKFDMEKGEGLKIKKNYNVNSYPTFLFLDSKGKLIFKAVGYFEANMLIGIGQNALKAHSKKLLDLKEQSLFGIYSFLLANPDSPKKDSLMNGYYSLIPNDNKTSIESWTLFYKYCNNLDSEFFDYFIKHRKQFELKFGSQKVNDKILDLFAPYVNENRKDKSKIKALFDIDSLIVTEIFQRNIESYSIEDCNTDKHNRILWDTLVNVTNRRYIANAPYDLFYGSVYVLENYRLFYDLPALKMAKSWTAKLIQINPSEDTYINLYANILFELEETVEAINYQQKAIKIATELNQATSAEKYQLDLDRYKKSLKE
jgi:thioredoxin-related protein